VLPTTPAPLFRRILSQGMAVFNRCGSTERRLCDNILDMRRFLAVYLAFLVFLIGLATAGGLYLFRETGPSDPIEAAADAHAYNVLSWEIRHLPTKWLYKLGHLFDSRSQWKEEEILRRYFSLTREIRQLERDPEAGPQLEAAQDQRSRLENAVEDILEGRITALLEEQGLVINPPLFSELNLVFPPVDFELDSPPQVLAVSPRDHIELDHSYLLAPGLNLATVVDIEKDAEATTSEGRGVSAVVLPTGGVATYPSVVSELAPYESLIEDIIHEWLHQYLVFFPLGRSYFADRETRTLNETVASLAGRELARLFSERYGSPLPVLSEVEGPPSPPSTAPSSGFDFAAEMRALRQRVEELLASGQIDAAERLMNEKRDEFERHGVYIRRINQAYFAFHGSYADTPASIDPIGPKLGELLRCAGSPWEFIRLASQLTSEADLDRLLAEG